MQVQQLQQLHQDLLVSSDLVVFTTENILNYLFQFVRMTGFPMLQLVDVTSISPPGCHGMTPEDIVN